MVIAVFPDLHAVILPSSVTKIKRADPRDGITNPVVGLNTCPVGFPSIVTGGRKVSPSSLYTTESCLSAAEIQKTPDGLIAIPQALTRLVSMISGLYSLTSETRLVTS